MTPYELMIGDWVIAHRIECVGDGGQFQEWKQIGYITRINEDTVYVMFDKQKEDWEEIDVKDIYPIPLTPEILEKNGWHVDVYSKESYDNEEVEGLSLWVGEDGKNKWWWHAGVELVTPINYVHELQHALRLCGITKNIIL